MLLVMDVDSTLIQAEVIELVAEHAGTREQVAAVTEAAMRGELDFEASLRARVATLAGLDVAVLEEVRRSVPLTPGARTLVGTFRAHGWPVGLVSGGFVEVVAPLAAALDIPYLEANRLASEAGRLTGEVDGPVVDRARKAAFLRELAAEHGIPAERTVAVGDGANDLDLLAAAGTGVAFCAKPALREAADVVIDECDLALVLDAIGVERLPADDDAGSHPLR